MDPHEPYRPPQADLTGSRPTQAVGQITSAMIDALHKTAPWVRFLGVLGMIVCALVILAAVFLIVAGGLGGLGPDLPPLGGIGLGLVYFLLSLLYFFPSLYLLRYGGAIKRMRSDGQAAAMEQALQHQASLWRFVGIAAAVVLGIYALLFIVLIVVGLIGAIMSS